jgi:hypothetical protein
MLFVGERRRRRWLPKCDVRAAHTGRVPVNRLAQTRRPKPIQGPSTLRRAVATRSFSATVLTDHHSY